MADLNVALRVVARDLGSREVRRAISEVDRATQNSARVQSRAIGTVSKASRQHNSVTVRESQRMHQARERLGIRSEKGIQREIVRTALAYKRLEQSGRLSGQELARASEAAISKIRKLQGEMRRLEGASSGGLGGLGKGLTAIGGGLMAGAMVARAPLSKVMDYDRKIAVMSNTAYAGEDVAARQAGQVEIKAAIDRAVQSAGGTRESAADALNELFSSSGFSRDEALKVLPQVQGFGLATGRDGGAEVAGLVGVLRAQGIGADQMGDALGKLLHAGETGGFGVENMVSLLPRILQSQRENFGMAGMQGLEAALANLTGITAATAMPAEAAQSYAALLNALKNPAIAESFAQKMSIGGRSVDLQGTIAKGVHAGVDPIETLAATIDQAMVGNKAYQRLKAKLGSGQAGEDDLEALSSLLESTVMRDVGIGRREMMALSGFMKNRQMIAATRESYAVQGIGAIEASSAVVRATASEKTRAADQAMEAARQNGLEGVTGVIGDVSAKLAEYANQYPGLTSAVVAATDAIKVMTAAALVFGGIKMLSGGKLGGKLGGKAGGGMRPASNVIPNVGDAARNVVTTNRVLSGTGKALGRVMPIAATGVALYEGTQILTSNASADDKAIAMTALTGQTGGAVGGGYAGAAAGAAIGSVVPGAGTFVGGIVGGLLGSLGGGVAGGWFGETLGNWFFGSSDENPQDDPAIPKTPEDIDEYAKQWEDAKQTLTPQDIEAVIQLWREPKPLDVEIKVSVDVEDGNIVAAVNEANAREARRH